MVLVVFQTACACAHASDVATISTMEMTAEHHHCDDADMADMMAAPAMEMPHEMTDFEPCDHAASLKTSLAASVSVPAELPAPQIEPVVYSALTIQVPTPVRSTVFSRTAELPPPDIPADRKTVFLN